MFPELYTDGYKTGHKNQYPDFTQLVFDNATPRSSRRGDNVPKEIVYVGGQMWAVKYLINEWRDKFFKVPKDVVLKRFKRMMKAYLGPKNTVGEEHIAALHDLGYLPIKVRNPACVLSEGMHQGHEWVTVHNGMGYRCGYVKVEPGHPWYKKEYGDVDASVHGGLTFSEPDTHCGKGGPDNGWWVGFDCAHAGDAPDPELPYKNEAASLLGLYTSFFEGSSYMPMIRTQEYVEAQCRELCEQAANATNDTNDLNGRG